jgi:nucleolar protein 14
VHKPIPIATYVPKFDGSFRGRTEDPDVERRGRQKLRAEYREARKGAMKELRKDGAFLAEVERRWRLEKDARYVARMKEVMSRVERGEMRK